MLQKIKILSICLAFLTITAMSFAARSATAAPCEYGAPDCTCSSQGCDNGKTAKNPIDCSSGRLLASDQSKCAPLGNDCKGKTADACLQENPIVVNINNIINFLSAGVGIVVIGVIILGGIQYTLAGDNSTATSAAKKRIMNGLIALAAFLFTFAFLQWLIPGGL